MFEIIKVSENEDAQIRSIISICEIPNLGCIVRTQSQVDGGISEALVFVPNVKLEGKTLVSVPAIPDGPMEMEPNAAQNPNYGATGSR